MRNGFLVSAGGRRRARLRIADPAGQNQTANSYHIETEKERDGGPVPRPRVAREEALRTHQLAARFATRELSAGARRNAVPHVRRRRVADAEAGIARAQRKVGVLEVGL